MWRVVTDMTSTLDAQAKTGLSPEWDRGFDEAFTELVTGDPDLVREEFDALIGANFTEPPAPPAPPTSGSPATPPPAGQGQDPPVRVTDDPADNQRSPP